MNWNRLKQDGKYVIINCFIIHLPSWTIRKFFFKCLGLKIGENSRIGINTKIICPEKIVIGERTIINEFCHLDGRGGIYIGNDVSVSNYSTIITASHKKSSDTFEYYEDSVTIEDNVWIGTRAIILNGSILKSQCVIGAGSVFKGIAASNKVYIPQIGWNIQERNLHKKYILKYNAFFR